MKFGQLIKYNIRNIFPKKSYANCGGETIPGSFSKISKLSKSLNSLKFYAICSYVLIVCKVEDYRSILKLSSRPLAFTSYKAFLKNKKRFGTSKTNDCLIYFMIFEEKYFPCYILLLDQVSLSGCFYFVRYWAIYVLYLFVSQAVTSKILILILSL